MEQQRNNINWIRWTIWLLAMIVILVYIVNNLRYVKSTDLWWHMALGRHYLETLTLTIDHSLLSWTAAEDGIYNHWLGAILLHLLYDVAGIPGLAALRFLVFGLFILLAWKYSKLRDVSDNPLVWITILLAISIAAPALVIKPALLSFGMMCLVVGLYYHIRTRGQSAWPLVYLFPVIIVLWQNIHGAFFLVTIFLLATVLGETLNYYFSRTKALPTPLRRHYLLALLLCIPALLINPYGADLPFSILELVLTNYGGDFSHIGEHAPTYHLNYPPFYLIDYMLLGSLLFLLLYIPQILSKDADWVAILSYLAYSFLFVQMIRLSPYLAPVLVFSVISAIRPLHTHKKYSSVLLIVGSLLLALFIAYRSLGIHSYCGSFWGPNGPYANILKVSEAPIDAANYIQENLDGERIGNLYNNGSYYLFRFWPERQVTIDSRAFPYRSWIQKNYFFGSFVANFSSWSAQNRADFWAIEYKEPRILRVLASQEAWQPAFIGVNTVIFVPLNDEVSLTLSPQIYTLGTSLPFVDIIDSLILFSRLDLADEVITIAQNNLDKTCEKTSAFIEALENAVTGVRASREGDYELAAKLLARQPFYPYLKNISADFYVGFGKDAMDRSSYKDAREFFIQSYLLYSTNSWIDLYNIAIADWAMRHLEENEETPEVDRFFWRDLVEMIMRNQEEITSHKEEVIRVGTLMLEGEYRGEGSFLKRSE